MSLPVVPQVVPLVQQFVSGITYKTHTNGQISLPVGKTTLSDSEVAENVKAFFADLDQARLSSGSPPLLLLLLDFAWLGVLFFISFFIFYFLMRCCVMPCQIMA